MFSVCFAADILPISSSFGVVNMDCSCHDLHLEAELLNTILKRGAPGQALKVVRAFTNPPKIKIHFFTLCTFYYTCYNIMITVVTVINTTMDIFYSYIFSIDVIN